MTLLNRFARPSLFVVLGIVFVGSLVWTRSVRNVLLPDALRYVPRGSAVILWTGDVESLWRGVETHFGHALDDTQRPGFLASSLTDLRKHLEEVDLHIAKPSDLSDLGLDVKRGVLIVVPEFARGDYLMVIGVHDGPAFLRAFSRFSEAEPKEASCSEDEAWPCAATKIGDLYFRQVDQETLVAASSPTLLDPRATDADANLAHARDDDLLYESVSLHLRRPMLSGPNVMVLARLEATGAARSVSLALSFEDSRIRLDGDVALQRPVLKLVDELLEPAPRDLAVRVGADEPPAVLTFRDASLHDYASLLGSVGWPFAPFRDVLEQASDTDELSDAVLVLRDYRDGIPAVLLGIAGKPESLQALVQRTRRNLDDRRDGEILAGAQRTWEKERRSQKTPTIEDLHDAEYLEEETAVRLEHAVARGDGGDVVPADSGTATESYHGETIAYLAPPVTPDDMKYRFYAARWEDLDPDAMTGNRYRLASVILDGVLWVAVDSNDVKELIDRKGEAQSRPSEPKEAKIHLQVNIPILLRKGLLSADQGLLESITYALLDLRDHRALDIVVTPNRDKMRLFITGESVLIGAGAQP